ncbi:MAG TPA: MFS transporter [Propionibacteriaceae bacterium]
MPGESRLLSLEFRRFWLGESVSSFGTYVTLLALQTLVVLTLNGDAQDVGWVNSARWLPYLLFGLVVGALVDRRRRQPVMVVTDVARAVLLGAIPAAWALGVLTLPFLTVVVIGYGAASLVNDAASLSFLPPLVPQHQLQRAHARIDGADAVAQTTGPVLAGVLIKLLGAPLAILVDAATYLFSAVMVATLRVPESTPVRAGRTSKLRVEIRDGVRWIYRGSGLARLAVATHVWFAANAILATVVAPFALTELGLSPLQFGLSTALAGIGGVLGAGLSTAGGRRLGTGGTVIAAHLASVVGVCTMASAGLGTSGWWAVGLLGLGRRATGSAWCSATPTR